MGKIDKEKLLKELTDWHVPEQIINIVEAVPEDSEEQEIDFDALYKDLLKDCGDSCTKDESCKACVFDFLKSKNLTQPQVDMDALRNEIYASIQKPSEIPVKKTGFLKRPSDVLEGATWIEFKGFKKALVDDNLNIGKRSELEFPEFCYTDIKEEPDYSKIPKGSIVEIECLGDKFYRTFVKFEHGNVFTKEVGEIEQWSPNVIIRVVELAKEKLAKEKV